MGNSFVIHRRYQPLPNEEILHKVDSVKYLTGKALPSYRVFFPIPLLMRAALVITNKRVVTIVYMFGLIVQEWTCWYRGQAPEDDPEIIQSASVGTHCLLGKYLEINSHHAARLKYCNWLCSPFVRIRFYLLREPETMLATISSHQGD